MTNTTMVVRRRRRKAVMTTTLDTATMRLLLVGLETMVVGVMSVNVVMNVIEAMGLVLTTILH